MTSPPPPPGPPRRSLRPRVPAVLRDEPQYRLLFTGQVLSILGDRVTMVVLPFAVLAVGGDVSDVSSRDADADTSFVYPYEGGGG